MQIVAIGVSCTAPLATSTLRRRYPWWNAPPAMRDAATIADGEIDQSPSLGTVTFIGSAATLKVSPAVCTGQTSATAFCIAKLMTDGSLRTEYPPLSLV